MLNSRSSGDEDSSPREQNGAQTEQLPPLHHVESEDLLAGMQEAERQETRAAYNGDEETNQEQSWKSKMKSCTYNFRTSLPI